MQPIADFFLSKLITNSKFNSVTPNNDQSLLFPAFLDRVNSCVAQFRQTYPAVNLGFVETYRSNALQLIHYNNGASQLKKNGMHHYGIAVDCIFIINGKRTYKGDITLLRKIFKENGLFILGLWDAFHVQFIDVPAQQSLRNTVKSTLIIFQTQHNITPTGEPDETTIAKAIEIFA
jgi:hypothetical protein